jgi:hypothetical protein
MNPTRRMTPQLVVVDTLTPQPWRNGQGATRELLVRPEAHAQGSGWKLRLSVADISAAAPFSAFPGVQRHFAVVQGDGVQLQLGGMRGEPARTVALTPDSPPLSFSGDEPVHCDLLGGPTRDLNLMLRGGWQGGLRPAQPGEPWRPEAAPDSARGAHGAWIGGGFFAAQALRLQLDAGVHADPMTGSSHDLPALSLLWFDGQPPGLSLAPSGSGSRAGPWGWWIEVVAAA